MLIDSCVNWWDCILEFLEIRGAKGSLPSVDML